MKCLILLSLVALSLGAVVPFGGDYQHLLHYLEHVYGYEHPIPTPYAHPYFGQHQVPVHEQVVEEQPIAHAAGHEVVQQQVVKDYGLPVYHQYPHEQVVEEHQVDHFGDHDVVGQTVVKDPVVVPSHYGIQSGYAGQYYNPYVHSEYPYGFLKGYYGNYVAGHYNPLYHQAGIYDHYYPAYHHYY